MRQNRRRRGLLIVAMLFGWTVVARPLAAGERRRGVSEWRVTIANPVTRMAVESSLGEASRWLVADRCQTVLTEFHGPEGQPLADRLTELGVDVQAYIRTIRFVDGTGQPSCRQAAAFTEAGSRVVFVCGRQFTEGWNADKRTASAVVLHEALHSLGLGENPPTSAQITRRVIGLCAGR